MNDKPLQYCNWTFWEVIKPSSKWGVQRDCDEVPLVQKPGIGPYDYHESVTITITRSGGKNWAAYQASLQPQIQTRYLQPRAAAQCPGCGRQVNGVNPYDDGETWRIINK